MTDFHGITRITAHTGALVGLVLGLGLLGTGLAYMLYYFIVQRLGALAASSVTYIPPVVALLMGMLFAGEAIGPLQLLAMACILSGVYLLQSGRRGKASTASERPRNESLSADARG